MELHTRATLFKSTTADDHPKFANIVLGYILIFSIKTSFSTVFSIIQSVVL